MRVREATDRDAMPWNKFVLSSSGGSFLQTWEWGEVQEKFGANIWRFVVEDNGVFQAVALVMKRDLPMGRSWLYVPRLIVVREAFDVVQEKLVQLGEDEKAVFVRCDPMGGVDDFLKDTGWQKAEREVQPQHTMVLDLAHAKEELLASMKSKTRYNVRLAERKGVKVRFSNSVTDIDAFLELSHGVSDRSGFQYHPDEYYRSIMEVLGAKGMAELAIAEYEGKILAAHLMVYVGGVVSYTHGASSNEKRDLMAPQYLYWQTILRAREKGMKQYDFFGVAPENADQNHLWAGVTRIKEGFGGKRVNYIGAYDFVLDAPMYTVFNVARRARSLLR